MPDAKSMNDEMKAAMGRRLRDLREMRKMEVEDLAAALEVTPDSVRKWERGDRTPNLYRQNILAAYFGVSHDYLITGENRPPSLAKVLKMAGPQPA